MTMESGSFRLATAERFARDLLMHDGLMTPVLQRQFGPMYAVEHRRSEADGRYLRVSDLRQRGTGVLLLESRMSIRTAALPGAMLKALRHTDTPFGQLLLNAGIAARSVSREITRQAGKDGGPDRLGRRHVIVNSTTGAQICEIHEVLNRADLLLSARQTSAGGA